MAKAQQERVLALVTEKTRAGFKPGLAVVLRHEARHQVYVKAKGKAAQACGFHSIQHDLAATASGGAGSCRKAQRDCNP